VSPPTTRCERPGRFATRGAARQPTSLRRLLVCCLVGILGSAWVSGVRADTPLITDIVPQPVADALVEFANQTGLQLVYETRIAKERASKGARAGLSATEALTQLLDGTGLHFEFLNARTVRIFESVAAAPTTQSSGEPLTKRRPKSHEMSSSDTLDEVIVLGLREQLSTVEYVQSVPVSVSVVRGDRLEMQGRDQLSDYGAYLPGFNAPGGYVAYAGLRRSQPPRRWFSTSTTRPWVRAGRTPGRAVSI